MRTKTFLFSSFFLPLVVCSQAATPPPAPACPEANATDFIRARCGATRYPDLCLTLLSRYAVAVGQSPLQLARVAVNATLARIRSLRGHVSALRGCAARREESAALRDCTDALGDAADQVDRTAAELRGLEALQGWSSEAAWRVSNAQTWMSAAMTYEDTCADEFQSTSSGGGAVNDDVCRRVGRVKQYTSNALALVNGLSGSGW